MNVSTHKISQHETCRSCIFVYLILYYFVCYDNFPHQHKHQTIVVGTHPFEVLISQGAYF